MNKSKLKSYAPAARREFIQAVTDRAHFYGLSENKGEIQPVEEKGDVAIIGGRAFPRKIAAQRKNLEQRIEREGFAQVMEAIAYTWFNRFLALRYMEIHGYLEHGFRVLSNPSGSTIPEILEQAAHVQLPGLVQKKVIDLKLDGSKDAELYRMILVAQCNALNTAMPFLFERIDDETELLLPDNLLHSDSLIRKLVTEIDEEDWQQVEIIGWLYQFYISEKKDQVIGKVVKPEDIPAATQLFTPNWIVKYMVQNSLGRMWLATYPNSSLKTKMEYYIEPAEQTDEVKAQLAAITPKELNPETITLLDPASGSGHILVEAYDLFKEIYLERGYRSRDIPRLILEKNLYGLDIDDRAAQMAGFALLMKARADDRRILKDNSPRLNVMAIQGSEGIDAMSLADALLEEKTYSFVDGPSTLFPETISQPMLTATHRAEIDKNDINKLLELFRQGKNFGSLIQIPEKIAGKLRAMANLVESNLHASDIFTQKAANTLLPFVRQAMVLAGQYDCVVANPPYMGAAYFNDPLKNFIGRHFSEAKADLYGCFISRNLTLCSNNGSIGMITIPNWMFLTAFEDLRETILDMTTIVTLLHNGRGIFGSDFGSCVFTVRKNASLNFKGTYKRLFDKQGSVASIEELEQRFHLSKAFYASANDLRKVPGNPIAYWITDQVREVFGENLTIEDLTISDGQNKTGDNNKFVRYHWEIEKDEVGKERKWFFYAKGGPFRRWYGNLETVVDWSEEARTHYRKDKVCRIIPEYLWYKKGITWSLITASQTSFRGLPEDATFDVVGSSVFLKEEKDIAFCLGLLNSIVATYLLKIISSTIAFQVKEIRQIPVVEGVQHNEIIVGNVNSLLNISKLDWGSFETSWDFLTFPLLAASFIEANVEQSWHNWQTHCNTHIKRMQDLETENNRIFIEAYGLQDELSPEVSEDQITLARADREADVKRLISYAVGCMMGRYRLDRPGLIYAHSGNKDFRELYDGQIPLNPPFPKGENIPHFGKGGPGGIFKPDDDGIIPVMDMDWFQDDAASRFEEFLSVAWPDPSPQPSPPRGEGALLEENLKFVADSLSPKAGETSRDTIRRYFSAQFYKDHLQTYKKRPIYWLFSSGKQRAFECLVYLHRYNEATLSRMRNEYVTPLQGKFSARAEYLNNEINAATSTSARTKLQKQLDALKKKQVELAAFDDLLRHYADKRIPLDLDDGVKVNYGKFGNLLAEVKTVTGGGEE